MAMGEVKGKYLQINYLRVFRKSIKNIQNKIIFTSEEGEKGN